MPGRRPIYCEHSKDREDKYRVRCCEYDYCNNDRTLQLDVTKRGTFQSINKAKNILFGDFEQTSTLFL